MTPIKLNHYAFNEGRTGYANGVARHNNPYYSEDGTVADWNRDAFDQWKAGWENRNAEMASKAKARRQERMGYED